MMALEAIRVLDLTRLAPGPYCTMLLGDLGADVIVVEEPPGVGRRFDVGMNERYTAFNALGRNKRSVGLNLKDEQAREAFLRLAEQSDVVIEGFRPGVVKRLGVDYETVSARNPRIVYCSLSGYGQTGPYAALVGHDINYISLGGALGMIGWPGQPPAIPLNVIADFAGGGLYAAFAILAAVIARQTTGRGQYVDMAMSDGVTSLLAMVASQYFSSERLVRPGEDMLNGASPAYCVYETADGRWLSIGCLEPWFWQELCAALGCEEFVPHQNNREKFPEMFEFLRRKFREKTRDEWFEELRQRDICVAPVYSLDETFADPHVRARGMVAEVAHPEFGTVRQVGVGPKFSETPGSVRKTAPRRGEDTEEVLRAAGYAAEEIAALKAAGAA
ncbi:MAG TPA: CaiB/BaiF CoA-transferase family protein, partial [Dehalococcoidia bacterium]|nr:CaiB/BaiF CoA-transferase family protein [Dehalococcoidia bacterium]